jgi:AraC-like DNA-binding protein
VYYKDVKPAHNFERYLPDGHSTIIIDLTEQPKFVYDNDTLLPIQSCKKYWFSGIRTRCITIPSGRDSEMFIVNFRKGRAYPFLDHPANELVDSISEGDLILPPTIGALRDLLLETPTPETKFLAAARFLYESFKGRLQENPFITYAVDALSIRQNKKSLEQLASKSGYSQKHLIHLFKHHVGLTPKTYLKIERFQHTIAMLEHTTSPDWAALALEAGFYDQAHFIHDFKQFSGLTPTEYFDRKSNQLNYIPVT